MIEKNVSLSQYTTLKIGGIAKNFYRPRKIGELMDLTSYLEKYFILGAGSNLLIDDSCEFEHVVYMGDFEKNLLSIDEEGIIIASSSIRIQKLLNFANQNGLGGAEYLCSLPAMLGGIIAMNAGRGKTHRNSISDFIVSVDIITNGKLKTLTKQECDFSYRSSKFLNESSIIASAKLKLDEVSFAEGQSRLKERINDTMSVQAINLPSAGSVFKVSDGRIMRLMKIIPKNKEGLFFSNKTRNWISNGGKGTYSQAIKLIKITEYLHKLFNSDIELEWRIWSVKD